MGVYNCSVEWSRRSTEGSCPMDTKTARSFAWTQGKADIALGLVAVAWGSSYLLMKIGLGGMGPFMVIAMRFLIAFAVVGAVSFRKIAHTNRAVLKYAAVLGLLLFGLFAFLTHGLETTSASNGGFLTAMAVVFVPIINAALRHRMPPRPILAGTLVTLAGIGLLSLRGGFALYPGDALCLAGAILYAVFIVATDRLAPGFDGILLGTWQLGFAGLYGLVCSFIFETPVLPQTPTQWGAILGLAVVCSAFGFVLQPVAQPHTTPEHTALLFSIEPVASAVLAFFVLGETLPAQGYLGAVLVLAGVVVASLPSREGDRAVANMDGAADSMSDDPVPAM